MRGVRRAGQGCGRGRGWRPRIMGVGNRFVSAAVIMQINTAGNLFKYRNKRSPPGAGAARAAVIYDSSLGNVSAFAPSTDAEPFCRFYITSSLPENALTHIVSLSDNGLF